MKDKRPRFDDKKHRLYSRAARKTVLADIEKRCMGSEAVIWERTKEQWAEFVKDVRPMGGRRNRQSVSLYDAVLLFAYYQVLPKKMSKTEFGELCSALWVPYYEKMGFADFNLRFLQRIGQHAFSSLARQSEKHREERPGDYRWEVEDYDPAVGIRYRFTSCPIAVFAKEHGFRFLMPGMCNPDYPMLKCIGATLIRTRTCALDDCCDYWIVGDRSPHAKEHPAYTDRDGYIRNR